MNEGMSSSSANHGQQLKTLHPPEQQRAEKLSERNKKRYYKLVESQLKELQRLYNLQPADKKDKLQALRDWEREHVENNYPGLGQTVAYAFPPVFLLKPVIHDEGNTGLFVVKQESDVRGHMAACNVELSFRLLNSRRERNRRTPLVIISNLPHENVLIWLEKARDKLTKEFVEENCPDMTTDPADQSSRYYDADVSSLKPSKNDNASGESDLIILDQSVGIIFVEVKSFSDKTNPTKGYEKVEQALQQLVRVDKYFEKVFNGESKLLDVKRHRVIALPNLTLESVKQICTNKPMSGVHFLTGDNLVRESMQTAEKDYNLAHFEQWWNLEFSDYISNAERLSSELMQFIIARLLGTLSGPCEFDDTKVTIVKQMNDAIRCTGKIFKSKTFTSSDFKDIKTKRREMDAILKDKSQYKRVHLEGPTRSGKTTITILKANNFLESDKTHVIVVDIYRGIAGRPGGCHVFKSIVKEKAELESRVHHLKLNANEDMLQIFNSKLNEVTKNGIRSECIMFIIDQILPICFWKNILHKIVSEYPDSYVWCSDGLLKECLGEEYATQFIKLYLPRMARVPPSVRKVLYQVDWVPTNEKEKRYSLCIDGSSDQKDSATESTLSSSQEQMSNQKEFDTNVCICMHGPFVLSIRHQSHRADTELCMLDCVKCAKELADILIIKLNLFPSLSKDSKASFEDKMLDCSIVILFGIPMDLYKTSRDLGEQHVEISSVDCELYSQKVASSKFIQKLEQLLPVEIMKLTAAEKEEIQDFESLEIWDRVLLCWVDKFQGVDRDVVIYLPSEKANMYPQISPGKPETDFGGIYSQEQNKPADRKLPVPGVTVSQTRCPDKKKQKVVSKNMEYEPLPESARDAEKIKMSDLYWSNDDIERYSDWDKTNLMFAGTRAEGQLILMVP